MSNEYLVVHQSLNLKGTASIVGAKNAVLPIMASLILTQGESVIGNVPDSSDVLQMIKLLESLGASVFFDRDNHLLKIDTTNLNSFNVCPDAMSKMRASILVMGPLLARLGVAKVALPGGCLIGARPIDLHVKNFEKLGVVVTNEEEFLKVELNKKSPSLTFNVSSEGSKTLNTSTLNVSSDFDYKIVFEYPSVGATENLLMFSVLRKGVTILINASFEPEVLDLIDVLRKMGAMIEIKVPSTLKITGVMKLYSVKHSVIPDRLEVGAILLAAAITGGEVDLPDAIPGHLDLFLDKLREMGHEIVEGELRGIKLKATKNPKAISFKTGPYPGFPTDLQAPMMAALCLAEGTSVVEETVFENRFMHVKELSKMGAQVSVEGSKAVIRGVDELYGTDVISTDIRAACSLILAGLAANGVTKVTGLQHLKRGYEKLDDKLSSIGARLELVLRSRG